MVFFLMLAFWGAQEISERGTLRGYLLAGIGMGFTASTKVNGVFILLPILAAHFLSTGLEGLRDRRLYLAGGLAVIAYLVSSPGFLIDPQRVLGDYLFEAEHYSEGHLGREGGSFIWYLRHLIKEEGPIVILAGVGVFSDLLRRSKPGLVRAAFLLPYFIFISALPVHFGRSLLPLLPLLFLSAASYSLLPFSESTGRRSQSRMTRLRFLGLILLSILWQVIWTTTANIDLTGIQSRDRARLWIEEHVDPEEKVALEAYAPWVDPGQFRVTPVDTMIEYPVDWYRSKGIDFLVFSEGMYGRFFEEPEKYSEEIERYEAFFQRYDLVARFEDSDDAILIYRIVYDESR